MHTAPAIGCTWRGAIGALPGVCAVCDSWSRGRLCEACVERFARTARRCPRCALAVPDATVLCPSCLVQAPPFSHAVAALDYEFPWTSLIAALKFRGGVDLAPALADLLTHAVRAAQVPRVDLVLPLPLGPARLAERGYNQSWELAWRAARQLGLPASQRVLLRWLDTGEQRALGLPARRRNVRGAFGVAAPSAVRGLDLALVDDVTTSGASATEATLALLSAGARSVQLWTLARTPAPA